MVLYQTEFWVGFMLVEALIVNVPSRAAALVATVKGFNVIMRDRDRRSVVELALSDPQRQLAVPDETVAIRMIQDSISLSLCAERGDM